MRYKKNVQVKIASRFPIPVHVGSSLRAFAERVFRASGRSRLVALALVTLVCVLAAGKLNFAVAVSMEGDFVGYVSSKQELDSIVASVQQTASGALGYDWNSPELTCRVAFGTVQSDISEKVADKLYQSIDSLGNLQLVYVDGEAVCAFRTRQDAVEAVELLRSSYLNETTQSARFAQDVSIAGSYASTALLQNNEASLASAVAVVTTERLSTEESLRYETAYIYDSSMFADERRVLSSGHNGVECVEYLLTRENGKLVGYDQMDSRVIQAPVTEVVKLGTRVRHSTGEYIWPVEKGQLTSYFGGRNIGIGSSYHQGIDIGGYSGDDILAADGGVVIFSDTYNGYGQLIQLQHDNGDITYYAHCSKLLVSEGDVVAQGQHIADMGNTGMSTGVHLHFEIHPGGDQAADPLSYLPEGVITEDTRP